MWLTFNPHNYLKLEEYVVTIKPKQIGYYATLRTVLFYMCRRTLTIWSNVSVTIGSFFTGIKICSWCARVCHFIIMRSFIIIQFVYLTNNKQTYSHYDGDMANFLQGVNDSWKLLNIFFKVSGQRIATFVRCIKECNYFKQKFMVNKMVIAKPF